MRNGRLRLGPEPSEQKSQKSNLDIENSELGKSQEQTELSARSWRSSLPSWTQTRGSNTRPCRR